MGTEDLVHGRRLTIAPRDLEVNLLALIQQGLKDGDLDPVNHAILSHAVRAARELADLQRGVDEITKRRFFQSLLLSLNPGYD